MKKVARLGIFGLVATACTTQGSSAPPATPGAAPPPLAQSVPPPAAFAGNPGFAFYGSGQPAPMSPALRMPAAINRFERINVAHLQAAARMPRRCDVPLEVADGVYAHLDCHPYQRIRIATKHASALKLGMMRAGLLRWNTNVRPLSPQGPAPATRPGTSPIFQPARPGILSPHSELDLDDGAPRSTLAFAFPGQPLPTVTGQALPDVVDHRLNGLEGPIKDQGDVGACTAFALSAVMDNALRRGNQNITTSPEHVWAHYAYPTMEDAAQGNLNKTIASFDVLPYSGREACELTRDPTDDCGQTYGVLPNTAQSDGQLQQRLHAADAAGGHRLLAYEELEIHPATVDEVLNVLASGADIWAGFDVDSSVWVTRRMQNFVIPDWSQTDGGHAVAIAGYRRVNGGTYQFLIHNSWGPKWGDGGYAWISQAMVQRWMHLAYKVKTDVDPGAPTSPVPAKTDEDCAGDQVMDSVTNQCVGICPDQSRPANGQCPSGPAPASQVLPLPPLPAGWQIPGWPWPGQQQQPGQQPAPAASGQPAPASSAPPGAWQIPSAWPSAWPPIFPPPPPAK